MTITGTIERIRFASKGFAVLMIRTPDNDMVCLSGRIFDPEVGRKIVADGDFNDHPKYGWQFAVESSTVSIPQDAAAVKQYLSSGLIKGIGPVIADRIVDHFGVNVIEDIIEKDPERLAEVSGISVSKALQIAKAHSENFAYQELTTMNLSISQIRKLFDAYGSRAVDVLKTDPYKIIYDIDGFAFKTVDQIALKNGVEPDDPKRISAAITFVLTEIGDEGHCWCHVDNLAGLIEDNLPDVDPDKISEQIIKNFDNGTIIADGTRVYAKSMYFAEQNTASVLSEMIIDGEKMNALNRLPVSTNQIQLAIKEMEYELDIELEKHQKQAISNALTNRVSVITGGPGTGKTTIIKGIVKGWMKQFGPWARPEEHILLCAPTGKASRRMSEVTGIHAETIQRILTKRKDSLPTDRMLVILDEASMLDMKLANELMQFVREKHFLVLIGDIDQLPSIGPGLFFRDCVQSIFVPKAVLTLSHRQSGKIAINAKRINDGLGFHALDFKDPSFRFVQAGKATVRETVINEYMALLAKGYAIKDIGCIVPFRKPGKSQTSAYDMNLLLRERINPPPTTKPIGYQENGLRIGDRVMNTENDYDLEVFNGDCGEVTFVDYPTGTTTVKMDDGRIVEFSKLRSSCLMLAYVITVHKSQGSEYKATIVVQNWEHHNMLCRNLLYTAVTRAKSELVLIGEQRAVNQAIACIKAEERNTSLKERISSFMVAKRGGAI